MLKRFAICAALVALEAGSAAAQEREAVLQKIAVPGTSFEMLVATASSPDGAIYDLGDTPDSLVIHLIGGKLWVGFEDAGKDRGDGRHVAAVDRELSCGEQRRQSNRRIFGSKLRLC